MVCAFSLRRHLWLRSNHVTVDHGDLHIKSALVVVKTDRYEVEKNRLGARTDEELAVAVYIYI